ncbi:MAG TPA: adenylyltransferase/cytidyltransferase family protein [Candidatus Mcinerneyibacterium sp.]|nr:adenylyltransferase/cytidyltransferase family protein [Candidatus Mcinerneyibacterium sp.]
MKNKIKELTQISQIIETQRLKGKKIGFISGCFDILHIGHVKLFEFAKSKIDILIIGVDDDFSIMQSKGKNRPIHSQNLRMELLSYLNITDYIFPVSINNKYGSKEIDSFWFNLLKIVKPDVLITSSKADSFSDKKKEICSKLKIKFIKWNKKLDVSSTKIEKLYIDTV